MSELEQFCEIDGHEWITCYLEYGVYYPNGQMTTEYHSKCNKCQKQVVKVFKPYNRNDNTLILSSRLLPNNK